MKSLRQLHLYLGCIFAPVLIFFAVTGAWQLFSLHRGTKDGSYVPPRAVFVLSEVHQYQHLPGASSSSGTPLRYFILAAAAGLVLTTTLGIIMAFRFTRSKASVLLCLLAGVVVPVAILLVYR
jgi:ABC-type nitrate/sulfonate/bicarbonate transport system permease component